MTALVDGSYADEYKLLSEDKYIIQMSEELYNNMRSVAYQIIAGEHVPNMMQRVLEEYRRRAGDAVQHRTIGGPYGGVKIVLARLANEP